MELKDKIKDGENENIEPQQQNEVEGLNENLDNSGDTLTPSAEPAADNNENAELDGLDSENVEENIQPQEKMLTQSQVNELVGRARQEGRESAMKELYARYGVSNDSEMNDIFGRGQAYDDLDYDYQNQTTSYQEALAENALLKSHIDENRYEDVKLILGGKGLEVNAENIEALLPSHPEWRSSMSAQPNINDAPVAAEGDIMAPKPQLGEEELDNMVEQQKINEMQKPNPNNKPMTLKKLGNEPSAPDPEYDERAMVRKELFGFDK